LGCSGLPREIGRQSGRNPADVGRQALRNHVLRHRVAMADAGVEAAANDIDKPIVDADV